MAERLGVPQQHTSRFENGETRMDVVQLWLYCRALGVSFSSLCEQLDKDFTEVGEPGLSGRRYPSRRLSSSPGFGIGSVHDRVCKPGLLGLRRREVAALPAARSKRLSAKDEPV